ncbi:hypothetical protein [Actinophytocola sediminis]
MTTTTTRPAPPPLEYQPPRCSLCGNDTCHDGDGWNCENCGASWDDEGNDDGEWHDPDAELCDATIQPLADNEFVTEEQRAQVYRCTLDAGHDADRRLHVSRDGWTYAKDGWM